MKLLPVVLFALLFTNCKKDDDNEKKDSGTNQGQLLLNVVGTAKVASSTTLQEEEPKFKPTSIASGAPEKFILHVTKISIQGKNEETGSQEVVNVFEDTAGKPVTLNSGHVDISELFTSFSCVLPGGTIKELPEGQTCECGLYADDESVIAKITDEETGELVCPPVDEARGHVPPSGAVTAEALTYTSINVTFKTMSEMTGCVSAHFSDLSTYPGAKTYCTLSSYYLSDGNTPQQSEFLDATASSTKVPLSKSYPASGDTLSLSFEINNGITLASGDKADLGIVIDANRILRFFNQGRSDEGPNPGFPTDHSYFFTTIFDNSFYAFAGKPGSIKGFSWLAKHCGDEADCENLPDADAAYVAGWMTIIYNNDGTPVAVGVMPDDDNTLTILKGGNMSASGLDETAFTKDGATYNIGISLSDQTATIKGINLDVEKDASQTIPYDGLDGGKGLITLIREL